MVCLQGESGALSRILGGAGIAGPPTRSKVGDTHRGGWSVSLRCAGPGNHHVYVEKVEGARPTGLALLTLATDRRQSPGTVQLRYRVSVGGKKRMCWTGNMSRQDINVDGRRWPGLHETEQP